MNFCRFYNKTRRWIDDKLIDPTIDVGQKYKPIESVFVPTAIIFLIILLLFRIILISICIIIHYADIILISRCDLKEIKEE